MTLGVVVHKRIAPSLLDVGGYEAVIIEVAGKLIPYLFDLLTLYPARLHHHTHGPSAERDQARTLSPDLYAHG